MSFCDEARYELFDKLNAAEDPTELRQLLVEGSKLGIVALGCAEENQVHELDALTDMIHSTRYTNESPGHRSICEGWTPLHIAVEHDDVSTARSLLAHGAANSHASNDKMLTPLHVACYYLNVQLATLLLDDGASPNVANIQGDTPLHLACLVNSLHYHGWAYLEAHDEAPAELVELLVSRGASVDPMSREDYDMTPLLMACDYGAPPGTVSALIKCGADVNHEAGGSTPLSAACELSGGRFSHAAVARCLLDAGADIDGVHGNPLSCAIEEYYASVDHTGESPISHGGVRDNKDTVLLLLARGADFTPALAKEREREVMGRLDDWDADDEVIIFDERVRSALWRRLQLYAFGKPARYTSSVPHRVAADPYLSRHIGSFLVGDVRPTKKTT
jgi:hypothetical protein